MIGAVAGITAGMHDHVRTSFVVRELAGSE
jgi:hypothetical protein